MASSEDSAKRPSAADPAAFLATAAEQVRVLRERAEATAEAVRAAAPDPDGSQGLDLLVGEVAGSLVERSGEIAAECRRLSELLDRVAAAQAAQAGAEAAGAETAHEQPSGAGPRATDGDDSADSAADEPRTGVAPGAAEPPRAGAEPPAPPFSGSPAVPAEPASPSVAEVPTDVGASGASDARRGGAQVSEGVKLLVTQMAVAGAGREEIEERLVSDFGISDPGTVLRELFGR